MYLHIIIRVSIVIRSVIGIHQVRTIIIELFSDSYRIPIDIDSGDLTRRSRIEATVFFDEAAVFWLVLWKQFCNTLSVIFDVIQVKANQTAHRY